MYTSRLWGTLCACVVAFIHTSSNAALFSRLGGQAVYDTDLNITWIADANLAASNTFGLSTGVSLGTHPSDNSGKIGIIYANGNMSWPGALFWIDAMNAANYLGFNDWRLPVTSQPDPSCSGQTTHVDFPTQGSGAGCTNSEMGHLSNVEGVLANTPGLFSNVDLSFNWSSTEYAPAPELAAWSLRFSIGDQATAGKQTNMHAWAVRSGDVTTLLRCDLNDNGEVDAGDLSQVLRMVFGYAADDLDCDINNSGFGDGVISIADLVVVSRIVLGIIPEIYN